MASPTRTTASPQSPGPSAPPRRHPGIHGHGPQLARRRQRRNRRQPADTVIHWKLMWRDPQPTWTSPGGRLLLLGDAARTFLPFSGNGGTQATEDAASLAACLDVAGGKEGVADATRVHNLLRFESASCLQALGMVNQANFQAEGVGGKKELKKPRVGMWIVKHDPEKYAYENYGLTLRI